VNAVEALGRHVVDDPPVQLVEKVIFRHHCSASSRSVSLKNTDPDTDSNPEKAP